MNVHKKIISALACLLILVAACEKDEKKKNSGGNDAISVEKSALKNWTKSETVRNGDVVGRTERTLNDNGQITEMKDLTANGDVVRTYNFEYDGDKLVKETEQVGTDNINVVVNYSYDASNRLSSTRRTVNDKLLEQRDFNYDAKTITSATYNTQVEDEQVLFTTVEEYYFAGNSYDGSDNFLILKKSETKNSSNEVTGNMTNTCDNEENPSNCTTTTSNLLTNKKISQITSVHSRRSIDVSGTVVFTDVNATISGIQYDQDENEILTYTITNQHNAQFAIIQTVVDNDDKSENDSDFKTTTINEYDESGFNITKSTQRTETKDTFDEQIISYTY